jgi:chemotaxis signal transduction protein
MSSTGGNSAGPNAGALDRLLDKPVTQQELAAGAEDAATPADALGRGTVGVLLFKLGDETLAIPAKSLRRITTYTRPSPIPHRTRGILRGLCNIRGELILCADIRRMLGVPPHDSKEQAPGEADPRRMVVIGPADASSWVFEADSLVGVERIDPAALIHAPMTVENALGAFVSGLAEVGDSRVTVLDADRILAGFKAGIA